MNIKSKIDKYAQDNNLSGDISIYRKQNSIYHNSFGYRDISNGGYVFLGIIIKKLSNLTYRDFMNENIFEPLNMNSIGFYAFDIFSALDEKKLTYKNKIHKRGKKT